MPRLQISIPQEVGGGVIEVFCSSPTVIEQVQRFFCSYISRTKNNQYFQPKFFITIVINPSVSERFVDIEAAEIVELYGRKGLSGYSNGCKVIQDNISFRCIFNSKGNFVLEAIDEDVAYREGRCLLRACLEEILFSRDFIFFHCAVAVSPIGQGVMIVGEKGSGKTSTLMALLEAGFRYLENDRTFIGIVGEQLIALPRPAFFRVGIETYKRSGFLQNNGKTTNIDNQGKVVFEQFLSTAKIPFLSTNSINVVVVADIFERRKKEDEKEELLQSAILRNFPGLAATRSYFQEHSCSDVGTSKILEMLRNLPMLVQSGTDYEDLIRFFKTKEA